MSMEAREASSVTRTQPRSQASSTACSDAKAYEAAYEAKVARWLAADYEWLGSAKPGFKKAIAGEHDFNLAVKGVTAMLQSGRGLCLTGAFGSGKTHLMRIVARRVRWRMDREWFDCGDSDGQLWRLDAKQNRNIEELFGKHVFMDDLGVETRSEYGRRADFVCNFIRSFHGRRTQGARLFITTNLDAEGLERAYDGRVLDRILEMCVVVRFAGRSKRVRQVFA